MLAIAARGVVQFSCAYGKALSAAIGGGSKSIRHLKSKARRLRPSPSPPFPKFRSYQAASGKLVGPSVDDWVSINVIDGSHDAVA